MALNALRSMLSGGTDAPDADPVVGGDTDDEVFACPACSRPIPKGSGRCSGCGIRLLLDVPAGKAATLLGIGLFAGLLVGGTLVGLVGASQPATQPAAAQPASQGAGGAARSGDGTVAGGTLPAGAAPALRAATEVNGRLAAAADPLARALDARKFSATDVAKVLRTMNVDVRSGTNLLPIFDRWADAAAYRAELGAFYEDVAAHIGKGLESSTRSQGAYKSAARKLLETLRRLPALDAAGRALAAPAGIELAPIHVPAAIGG